MRITINGRKQDINGELSVADLLTRRETEPIQVAVEINEEIVSRKSFADVTIRDGDRIEIVTFVGGG